MSTQHNDLKHPSGSATRARLPLSRLVAAIGLALYGAGAAAETFTVTHNVDDFFEGSLRAAVADANASRGIDRITFDPAELDGAVIFVDTDELLVTEDLIISGPGRELLTIAYQTTDKPLFRVTTTTSAIININGLTVVRASDEALGIIEHDGVAGRIIVSETDMVNAASSVPPAAMPAAISGNNVAITIDSSLIDGFPGNTGGAINLASNGEASLDIIGTTISNNSAPNGGAIFYESDQDGLISISHSRLENNTANSGNGGAIYFQGNDGSMQDLVIDESVFIQNSAEAGGGALFLAAADTDTTVNVFIDASSFVANGTSGANARGGGAIEVGRAGASSNRINLDIVNSTISGNSAIGDGGGIATFTGGSEIDIDILNSTFAQNSSDNRGGGIFVDNPALVEVRLTNSIVANNDMVNGGPDIFGEVSYSYSLLGDSTDATLSASTGSLIDIDPLLTALCSDCYETPLYPLKRASPAINAGDSQASKSDIPLPDTDQRVTSHDRISGAAVDMGAFEYELPPQEDDDDDDDGLGFGGWLLALMALLAALRRTRALS